jgi:hypothetical protein
MRRRHLAAAGLATGLVLAVGWAGRSLIGRATRPAPRQWVEHSEMKRHEMPPGEVPVPPPLGLGPNGVAAARMLGMEAHRIEGGRLAVSGEAEVIDRRPGYLYVWLLRLYTPGGPRDRRLVWEHHYLDDAAGTAPGRLWLNPAFGDVIGPRPGEYEIELILYGVPPDWPFEAMGRGFDPSRFPGGHVSGGARVSVPGP